MQNIPMSQKLSENMEIIKRELGADTSFDIVTRELNIGRKNAALIFIDGFIKDEIIYTLQELMNTDKKMTNVNTLEKIIKNHLPFYEIEVVESLDNIIDKILEGSQALLVNGLKKAVIIKAYQWLTRTPEEPELEKSTRGPGDGFVETMLFNVNAVRRRIRDVNFRAEVIKMGKRTKTDVALLYIKDIINPKLVNEIKDKLKSIDVDGIPLGDKSIEEIITGGTLNPLPLVRYTERPDNVAAHILEGHLSIIVDNSPTALILPAPFFSHLQTLELYRKSTLVGTYLSFNRLLAIFVSVLLPPIWLFLANNRNILPENLLFIGTKAESNIGLGIQFIIASLGIDLIRMASIQTPGTLATSLSLIGALILGDFAVKVGLFSPEVILYMAIAAIGNFAIPGYELALVLKMIRFILLIAVIIADFWGFMIIFILVLLWFGFTKTFGIYYLWPLIPFEYQALKSFFVTETVMDVSHTRPEAYNVQDKDRAVKEDDREKDKRKR